MPKLKSYTVTIPLKDGEAVWEVKALDEEDAKARLQNGKGLSISVDEGDWDEDGDWEFECEEDE